MAQYGTPDNGEDNDAVPQQTLDNLIGQDGLLTSALKGGKIIKRSAIVPPTAAVADRAIDPTALLDLDLISLKLDRGVIPAIIGAGAPSDKMARKTRRTTLGETLAEELTDANKDVDLLLAENDRIANNLLGVCGESTTTPTAPCEGVTQADKSG